MSVFQTEPTKIYAFPTSLGENNELFENYALDLPISVKGTFEVKPQGTLYKTEVVFAMVPSYATLENSGPLSKAERNAEIVMSGGASNLISYHILQATFVTISNPSNLDFQPEVVFDPGTEVPNQGWDNKNPQEVLDIIVAVSEGLLDSTNLWNLTKVALGDERRKSLDNVIFIPAEDL